MIEIIPAVLSPKKSELSRVARALHGVAKTIQLDVCDGVFVRKMTWPYTEGAAYPGRGELAELAPGLAVEVDLMVKEPASVIEGWINAGAKRLIIHAESTDDLKGAVASVNRGGAQSGVAISIATPLSLIEPVIADINVVQLMGIRTIGWQGEPFEPAVTAHIRELRETHASLTISVDGGVSEAHVRELVEAGANRLAVGSSIVSAVDMKSAFEKITAYANG